MTNVPDKTPLHGGDVYLLARTLGVELADLLDFSANINPLGFPPGLTIAVQEAMREIVHYPDRRSLKLRAALADYHHLSPEEILVGNGSTELIYLVARALRPRRGLIVTPAFSEYEHALNLAGVPADFYPTDEAHNFTLSEVPEPQAGDLVFLAHPASPSGVLLDPELFLRLAARCEAAGAYLLLDEAFVDFVEEASLKIHLSRFPRLLILRSFTKFFGIPGMRLGFLLGRAGIGGAPVRGPGALVGEHHGPGHGAGLPGRLRVHQPNPGPDPTRAGISLSAAGGATGVVSVSQRGELSPGETHAAGDDRGRLAGADAGPPHRHSGRQQFPGAG